MSGFDDDDVLAMSPPSKRRKTAVEEPTSATSSSPSSAISSYFTASPRSRPQAGLKVDVQTEVEGVTKRVKSAEESPSSAPTTPSTKAAATEKLKGGAKQMSDLLQTIQSNQICETQGKNWKDTLVKKGKVAEYLKRKMRDQLDKCKKRSAFDYLRDHNIDSQPDKVKEYIDTLDIKHGKCLLTDGSGYPQLKVPCSAVAASKSDKTAGKSIGLIQVQSYNLAVVLDEVKTDDELVQALQQTIADAAQARTVGGHLCKRVCLNSKHIRNVSANVNVKFHESCPGLWVIEDKLISFCHCPAGGEIMCMAPGGLFQASASCRASMKDSIVSIIGNTSNVPL